MVGPPVGVDDEVGDKISPCRLDQDMDAAARPAAAGRITDDPAHRIACRDRSRAHQLLAGLKCNVGHLAGACIDLIERAIGIGILLDGIDESAVIGLNPRSIICRSHPAAGVHRAGAARGAGRTAPR